MSRFFDRYADLTAMILTLLLPLLLTIYLKRRARKNIRAIPVYFFVFGPLGILSFIFFHLAENSYRAIEAAAAHQFTYTFRFYSLILFGLVVAYLGGLLLKTCMDKCLRQQISKRRYFLTLALLLAVTGPVIPLTPIAAVPSICCAVSLLAFAFVSRRTPSGLNNGKTGKVFVRNYPGLFNSAN